MSTTLQLLTHRATAGARYVAAVAELRAAFGDLAAIERLLNSGVTIAAGNSATLPVATFGGPQPDPIHLRHPVYLSGNNGTANMALVCLPFEDDIRAAFATRSAAWPTSD